MDYDTNAVQVLDLRPGRLHVETGSRFLAWCIYRYLHRLLGSPPEMSGEVSTPVGNVSIAWRRMETSFTISGMVPGGIPFRIRWGGKIDSYYKNGGEFHEVVDLIEDNY